MQNTLKLILIITFFLTACDSDKNTQTKTTTQVKTENFLLNAKDFDLETIVALVKEDKVSGAEELEKLINSDSGINNVDLDKDNKIDPIKVKESRDQDGVILEFIAQPQSEKIEETTVASFKFKKSSESIEVEAAYPSYVQGHDSHYYHYSNPYNGSSAFVAGAATGLFAAWLFTPSRPVYVAHYPSYYVSRPVYSTTVLERRRISYKTTTKVASVPSQTKPATYKKIATQTPATSFKQKASSSKDFKAREQKETKKATGFGAKPATAAPAAKPKSSWGSGSAKPKSSWGSSSKPKPKSSWGSSGSRSRSRSSFGSSRSRRR